MRISFPGIVTVKAGGKAWRIPSEKTLRLVALAAIVALAAGLRFANLGSLGYANHYYTAAIASMLKSWHNFFFVAAEPGGSVSVDKPPLGLWIQAISAYFLGVNGLGVLLPQILAGILSVILIYHLVRRSFGTVAGLLAALVMSITPIVVATDRNNTIDSPLILTLLLAAWAFIKATESGKLRWLMLGAVLVGLGFNIKMLQAYLPLPAFFALYFLVSAEKLWRKVGKLVLASALLLVVSLSWAVAVDLTPADQRPYVGSSGDNSETNLILVYNGIDRLLGMFGRRGGSPPGGPAAGGPGPVPGQIAVFPQRPANGYSPGFSQGGAGGNYTTFPPGAPQGGIPPGSPAMNNGGYPWRGGPANNAGQFPGGPQGGPGGPSGGTGKAGPLRLFTPPLSKEVSWLLPFGLVSALLLLAGTRLHWPIAPKHQALVLWGGWLLTSGIFFSIAGFFHEYYLSMLAPPLAALVAIGVIQLWRLHSQRPWLAVAVLLAAAGGTLSFQVMTAQAFIKSIGWLPEALALFAIGSLLLIVGTVSRTRDYAAVSGFVCIMAAILVTPGIWSGLTTFNSSENQSLPSAYGGGSYGPANRGGLQVNQALLNYLEANTQDIYYLMAVPSSMQGADYVLATGRPVLYLGGFMGQDQVETADDLAQMVSQGVLRFIYFGGNGRDFGRQSSLSTWVESTCKIVQGFDTTTRNSGSPDGTYAGPGNPTSGQNGGFNPGPGGMQSISLYDCGS
jgi:4-amino-4-deoxy-L-arabinose transferase-like glycosyltransferase